MKLYPYKHWYKGNTHCHSSRSDGLKDPLDVFRWYREANFDFLALTDHSCYYPGGNHDGLLVLPGVEEKFHIVGLGMPDFPQDIPRDTPEQIIAAIKEHGGIPILGHPYWSRLSEEDLTHYLGALALEVYNSVCDYSIARGYSMVHWDRLLESGHKLWGIAADDAHWKYGAAGKGYIMVNTDRLTCANILDALRAGTYFSTQGPCFQQIEVEDNLIRVQCTEVVRIDFVSDIRGKVVVGPQGVTEAEYDLTEQKKTCNPKYVRIQITDANGKTAWSNPVFLG